MNNLVEAAVLRSSSFLKPNPYIEFSVDDKSPRKTEVSKSTYQPKWNEEFTVLVTPHSKLHFRLLDHSTFRKDTLIGEKRLSLFQILTHYNGKLENLELTLDLISESKHDSQLAKVGELVTLFDGLKIDMANVTPPNAGDIMRQPQCPVLNGVTLPLGRLIFNYEIIAGWPLDRKSQNLIVDMSLNYIIFVFSKK